MGSLKSALSNLMPVAQACSILGEDRVSRIVRSLLMMQEPTLVGDALKEEITNLVNAMLYTTSSTASNANNSVDDNHHHHHHIPPPIRDAWKKLASRPLVLDKPALIKFLVPQCAKPHTGPGGHMGLFDCLSYALQNNRANSSNGASSTSVTSTASQYVTGATSNASLPPPPQPVALPDILIFFAVCENYWKFQNDAPEDDIVSFASDHPTIMTMAQLMFLVYDSFQKKGTVVRDTIHRFLSDVLGDDSFKQPAIRDLLDKFFARSMQLTSREFTQAISDTLVFSPHASHVLLDWMAHLCRAMIPVARTAESTRAFLQTMDMQQRWLPQICELYQLADHRLYEIKRRFHSLVESSTTVIQGDPMSVEYQSSSSASNNSNSNANSSSGNSLPKHVIPLPVFVRAVCTASEDLGHGGYVPPEIAKAIFVAVATMNETEKETKDTSLFWDLTHVLQFGGLCLRSGGGNNNNNNNSTYDETALIKWIFFVISGRSKTMHLSTTKTTDDDNESSSEVAKFLTLLCQHMDFRLAADKPDKNNTMDDTEREDDDPLAADEKTMQSTVSLQAATELGLLPESYEGATMNGGSTTTSTTGRVPIKVLVDNFITLVKPKKEEEVSVEEVLAWHGAADDKDKDSNQRLSPFVKELRLIASVLFGVPPILASMEQTLVAEIQRRHKARYPQTDVSRRGPRGTVWYIVDDLWYRTWNNMIQKVSFTPEDAQDLRDKASGNVSPRRLGKISNKGLLRDNGSLALRVDIKWRHDYEIIPPLAWSALQAWYDGGPPIHRSVVPYLPPNPSATSRQAVRPSIRTENEIELYPFFVTMFLCDASSRGEARPFQQSVPVSRVSPVMVLLVDLCKELDVNPSMGRLWVVESTDGVSGEEPLSGKDDWLLDLDANIVEQRKKRVSGEQGGSSNINLLLELKDEESGLWPRGIDGKQWSFKKKDPDAVETGDGVVGLYNMGNTCYLNSSIQCLSHTPIFRDYFTTKSYLNDINTTNPLGHEGRLAQVSAVLINSLWKRFNTQAVHQPKRVTEPGLYAPVSAPALTPKTFKESLGKFNDIFDGNEQHDAQELLAFLLGGLSEDLNRIVDKPYIQAPDSDGRPDSELADIWWSNHLKREMSIIVALFTGQYKSLLRCKTCKYESARFEPFSFLQLPLPEDDTIPVTLIMYSLKPGVDITKYSVRVHTNGTLYDVLICLAKVLHADETEEEGKEEQKNESIDDAEKKRLAGIFETKAANMAVVDMREGFILKIAPNAWRLVDLQNKDTGELPLLHVYELDALPVESAEVAPEKEPAEEKTPEAKDEEEPSEENDESEEKTGSDEAEPAEDEEKDEEDGEDADAVKAEGDEDAAADGDKKASMSQRCSFLAIAQRRSEVFSKDILHPLTHYVFGTPLLMRVVDLETLTNKQVYDMVAARLKNFVPSSVMKFLDEQDDDDDTAPPPEASGKTKAEIRQNLTKTMTDMEEVAAGSVPRYGFRLRLASRDGRRCSLCPWYDCCIGCLVPDDNAPTVVMCGDSMVIDWHFAVDVATNGFGSRSAQVDHASSQNSPFRARIPGMPIKNHTSCGTGLKSKGYPGAISLEDCLDAFAKEEKIPEAYCSKCKEFRVQTKRMSLWRLPPVVIIQLKRFQFTQTMRRKLRDFVHFPVEGLDLSRIMAADTTGTQTNTNDKSSSPSKKNKKKKGKKSPSKKKKDAAAAAAKKKKEAKEKQEAEEAEAAGLNNQSEENGFGAAETEVANNEKEIADEKVVPEEDEEEATAATTAEVDDASDSALPSQLNQDDGRSEMLYDLYGVVHHQGALSGGHYVASLKSESDGQWRLFNDAQIYEIHSRDVVDSSAYILFYIRRDVKTMKLSDFWDTSQREGGLTEEEMDKLIRGRSERCVIS